MKRKLNWNSLNNSLVCAKYESRESFKPVQILCKFLRSRIDHPLLCSSHGSPIPGLDRDEMFEHFEQSLLTSKMSLLLLQRATMLWWAWLDGEGAISELDLCRTHFLWHQSLYSAVLWMGWCCSLSHSCFRLEFTSHQQPLSRRGCCKVKSVRVFGDIMDEWSQVEWSRQKEPAFIQHSK